MFFAILVLCSAFLIEVIGTFISVIGLSDLFARNPIIMTLAVALDLGKVVTVSFLYKHWKKINFLMKSYMTLAAIVLMTITSTGAFGYLSGQFQHSIETTNKNAILLQSLKAQQAQLESRKEQIDAQIAKIPPNYITGRRLIMQQYKPATDRIDAQLAKLSAEIPKLEIANVSQNTTVGPIIYVAQAFNTDPEHAVKYVILIIIFVFDPLAISLILAGNFLIEQRQKKQLDTKKEDPPSSFTIKVPLEQQVEIAEGVAGRKATGLCSQHHYAIDPRCKVCYPEEEISKEPEIEEPAVELELEPEIESSPKLELEPDPITVTEEVDQGESIPIEQEAEALAQEPEPLTEQAEPEQPELVEPEVVTEPIVTPPLQQSTRVLPSGVKQRETISMNQLRPRATLEDGPSKHDVTMNSVNVR
jgi:hypothetical protein